jgi:hypothetical protein
MACLGNRNKNKKYPSLDPATIRDQIGKLESILDLVEKEMMGVVVLQAPQLCERWLFDFF